MNSQSSSPLDLVELIESGIVDTVVAAFPDHYGRLMGKRLTASYYRKHVHDGAAHACNYLLAADMELEPLPGFALASWEKGYGDFVLKPDVRTLRQIPWMPSTALVVCDLFHEDGRPVEESPRRILQRQVERARSHGFSSLMASEMEFFLFRGTCHELAEEGFRELEPTTPYLIDYHILGTSYDEEFLHEVRQSMEEARIEVEGSKGEWGKGQHEVNLACCDPLEMADRHVIFKEGLKLLALPYELAPTFMAKVHQDMAGSSCHIHTSLQDKTGGNVFWDEQKKESSALFRAFLAGCMKHARHLSLFFAPLVNSYKRYQSTSFAPTTVAWAPDNRTCGFRIVGHDQSFRMENRIPGADVNPYLAYAATLAAGLDGIEQEMELPPPAAGNAYEDEKNERVPTTLVEAIETFQQGDLVRQAMGDAVAQHYLRLAQLEQAAFDAHVTDWELWRYFERG